MAMTGFPFSKMSGSGNDFILMDHREVPWQGWDLAEMARRLCRRRISVGADGLILLVPPRDPEHAFAWRFFNADGSEAEMCGNGARCAARFAVLKGLAPAKMQFETLSGVIEAQVEGEEVRVRLGNPSQIRPELGVIADNRDHALVFMDTGVPHAVGFVRDLEDVDVAHLGRTLRHHDAFAPRGTNVDFVQVVDRRSLRMRTYERGVEDETLACGTGAVASAIAAHLKGHVEPPVSVITRSGRTLRIHFKVQGMQYTDVSLEGDALRIYDGVILPDAFQ
jgi:diaminopimelate epimerase